MIEEELRAVFARHEGDLGDSGGLARLRAAIDREAGKRRRARRAMPAAAVAVFAVTAGVGVPAALDRAPRSVPPPIAVMARPPAVASMVNALLVVMDDADLPVGAVVAHLPADRGRIYLVSLPILDSPQPGELGARRFEPLIAPLPGVTVDMVATAGPEAITQVVDGVGGVRACLPGDVPSWRDQGRVIAKGCRNLDGATVADLLRSDGARENIQRLLVGMLEKAAATDLQMLAKLLYANGIELDLKGLDPAALGGPLRELRSSDVVGLVKPDGTDGRADFAALGAALKDDTLGAFVTAHPEWVLQIQR